MKMLSEFIEDCKAVLEEYGDLFVVNAIDAEGNGYDPVYYPPSIGHYDEDEREFQCEEYLQEIADDFGEEPEPINAVCVN